MTSEPRIMPLLRKLEGQDRSIAIEAIYLLARYLSHRLTPKQFLAQTSADAAPPGQDKAVPLVLDMVASIEAAEGRQIGKLSNERRLAYQTLLITAFLTEGTDPIDPAQIEAILKDLRATV
jgi:hypothetical protein